MISELSLKNFKSLKNVTINLKGLNIITGVNGVGKSSVIQSILLLRQSYLKNQLKQGIPLDGELTGNLGNVRDLENIQSEENNIEISINKCKFSFNTKDRGDDTILKGHFNLSSLKNNSIFSVDKFQYISASRISPNSNFIKDTYNIENKQFGKYGESVVPYISEVGKKSFKKSIKYKPLICLAVDEKKNILPLENQINFWLNYISNGVRLNIIKTTSTKYELNFEFYDGKSWNSFTASNSAFGLTYSLPIITSLLAASSGDIIILENPESDLHPQAQSKLGELIARCANEGVQLIVETHSDHILNGIRVAISKRPSLLSNTNVKVFYFYKELNNSFTDVKEINIDEFGRMPIKELKANNINGFFDQIDIDYKEIFSNLDAKV